MSRKHNRSMFRLWVYMFGGILALIIVTSIIHDIGWLILFGLTAFVSYRVGQRNGLNRASRTRRLRANASYGGRARLRGVREPVESADVVSAYPPELTEPEPAEPAQSRTEPRTVSRSSLLRDGMSGVRNLFREDDDD